MTDNTPAQPSLSDVRVVLCLVAMVMDDSADLPSALCRLLAACEAFENDMPNEHWGAAFRFVVDALLDGAADALRSDLDEAL